ncbi:MAG: guanosine-3',5'-bis(diphosphate) 3'-pyrophosphohydrolase [Gallionellales bacterium 35-53-114]|jgi:GTP pyrophosphokinase|nr:MAG: guanosine-3',5'-bis(diphosphate) 3'-pyrophosphohydrolase [Gallionellales bacterium 35-53-114]OYZ63822.1 MAG: guanosine-3',5'-bis(diphosphate) 3'-pyrophosphohydrolase [Gallionellales bacterium 24-53-125]OZB09346.1 MAG: guanosine-3',5'-bis(diphosphate) 3'-pyrophosphohydrolase [Gallionellales bacterium 39-52-133]HQS57998.1 bifunctional (p)ppGpp synthetase/guanosine-3',5'-bis(diphosphate) 3'-pyrophosphohydrolase [Gallionellaceae bacterium]HQS76159.1 bifunctional (p)ppGpp synthetase/guanosin
MSDVEELLQEVSAYLKPEDVENIQRAVELSKSAHHGQLRQSGEAYVTHPIAVARILTTLHLDAQAIIAALLHDVVEDTDITVDEIAAQFGKPVADVVEGLSKLDKLQFETVADAQAENFRKMLMAMARDVRVILIKLADRLHNMRTLGSVSREKSTRIARETMEIYAPIANRLGLNDIFHELQDLSFKYLHPNRFSVLSKALKMARGNRREVVGKIQEAIRQRLAENDINAEVKGREKHLYGIYQKMQAKSLAFSQVLDIYGFRVMVEDVNSCYIALGLLHGLYKPIPGKFKDYIAIPKANGYQSLHTTLFGPFGTPIEVQIRTVEMARIADAGVASHWLYKTGEVPINELHVKTHQWLQSLLESLSQSGDSVEFLEHLKVDLFPDEVYVFTPQGKILALPRGATTVDFAYSVHTDIGNRCVAAKVNFELVPLRTELKNGDRIEIITAPHAHPNPAWLGFVVTSKARGQIRHTLKTMHLDESAALGERLLNQALNSLGLKSAEVEETSWEKLLKETGAKSRQEIFADIGLGRSLNTVIARKLARVAEESTLHEAPARGVITILGNEGMAVQFGKCCMPIPGDPIIGVIKSGQGLVVHTHDCHVLRKGRNASDDWLDVAWDKNINKMFEVSIKLIVANQRGVLAKVATAIADAESNIENVNFSNEGDYTALYFTLQVNHRLHLANVMRNLRLIPEVIRISRIKNTQQSGQIKQQ